MDSITHSPLKGVLLAIAAAILWGLNGAFTQYLFEYRAINTEWLVTMRLLLSGLFLLLVATLQKKQTIWKIWQYRKHAIHLFLFGTIGMLAVQYTYFAAIAHSNAATATVIQYAGPALIVIYLALKRKKWPTLLEYVSLFTAITGTFLLVSHGQFGALAISQKAFVWGVASAFALAFYSVQPVYLLQRYPSIIVVGWAMVIGGILFSFVHAPWKIAGQWDLITYLFFSFIIFFGTIIPFNAYLTAVKLIGPQKTSLLASAEPLSATAVTVFWLHVPFVFIDWIGTLLIISTVFLLIRNK